MSANPESTDGPVDNASVVSEMRPALVKYFKRKTGNPVEAEDLVTCRSIFGPVET
jgi:DNA-directed RNA polymerase specialized sigma24 family protein